MAAIETGEAETAVAPEAMDVEMTASVPSQPEDVPANDGEASPGNDAQVQSKALKQGTQNPVYAFHNALLNLLRTKSNSTSRIRTFPTTASCGPCTPQTQITGCP